ncbi:flagellar protein MotY [Ketobacter sp.]
MDSWLDDVNMWRILLIILAFLAPSSAFSHTYEARVDESVWHLDPSPLQCRLWQSVPNYGDAVFEANAGQTLQFYMDLYRPISRGGKAEMSVEAPEWRSGLVSRPIGTTDFKAGRRPIELAEEVANQMLAELQVGMTPSFSHPGWFNEHPVTVGVSAVNFQRAYRDYLSCVSGLYPANFEELRQSRLLFGINKVGINPEIQQRLDLIAGYINLDPSIKKIYIDGYADKPGRRGHNWELSRLRAAAVKTYLEEQGVMPELIVMNYHGEGRSSRRFQKEQYSADDRRASIRLVR